ncbi:phage head-tail connector protein [Bacillaceae bacterium C204]|uniref:phage head-tail connector protein n=1 Tax=Neobacillus sp. 204 TaxID=3383351 RepID=UPI00397AFDAD
MDIVDQEDIIEKARLVLDIPLDVDYDSLLEYYFQNAVDFISDYCNLTEVPTTLFSVLTQMIVFQYRQKGVENIQSEGKGSLSESYLPEYPSNIMNRLSRHAQVKFL